MRIIGHGIDLVDTERVARMLADHGDQFLERCFSVGERAYIEANRRKIEHVAGRFAAKEAILKALGTGWRGGITWPDAEVVKLPSGQPTVALHGECLRIAAELGITQWTLSITHIRTHAMASAIAMGE